jgi:hypothetical protein
MSAASPARSPARDAAPTASAPARAAQAPAPKAVKSPGFSFAGSDTEDQFKLNLGDIPKVPYTMDVEGFKPSLLVRLVNLVVKPK